MTQIIDSDTEEVRYRYRPVNKSRIKSADAQAIGEMLEENRTKNGGSIDFEEVI